VTKSSSSFHFSAYPQFLLDHKWSSDHMITILYLTIVLLSIVVYKLGFARKLPVLKSVVIYVMLLIGCILMTILSLQLPIVGALTIAALILSIYKVRLARSKKQDSSKPSM
jgi:hypothetical protein